VSVDEPRASQVRLREDDYYEFHGSDSPDVRRSGLPCPFAGRVCSLDELELIGQTEYSLSAPSGCVVHGNGHDDGTEVVVRESLDHGAMPLAKDQRSALNAMGWRERVGEGLGVWVSVQEQVLRLVEEDRVVWQAPCATAAKGTGCQMDSYQTPTGWHSVSGKTGDDAPWGQVFKGGRPTGEVWQAGVETAEDLVLTRILFLSGEEAGFNKGGNVDSRARCIYVHGTNDEERVGTPTSHGCIRLRNDDVMMAYGMIPEGTPLLISDAGTLRSE
jgi:L,D-transpeptidase catalytic domain